MSDEKNQNAIKVNMKPVDEPEVKATPKAPVDDDDALPTVAVGKEVRFVNFKNNEEGNPKILPATICKVHTLKNVDLQVRNNGLIFDVPSVKRNDDKETPRSWHL
jgi:hypothetical protein